MSGAAIIIPARFASVRFPGKPLAPLMGVDGHCKPLVQRSWETACQAVGPDRVWIATDDARIAQVAAGFGGQVVMTPAECRNGTERCAEAVARLDAVADVVVNLQGDAPLTPPSVVAGLVEALARDSTAVMATPALRCSESTLAHLLRDQAAGRVGGTTVVTDREGRALYFSKCVLPHLPRGYRGGHDQVFLHLGVYAYRPGALGAYAALPPSPLEKAEGLEQLRFVENGLAVRVMPFDPPGWDCIELNNPEDSAAIEAVLQARGIA